MIDSILWCFVTSIHFFCSCHVLFYYRQIICMLINNSNIHQVYYYYNRSESMTFCIRLIIIIKANHKDNLIFSFYKLITREVHGGLTFPMGINIINWVDLSDYLSFFPSSQTGLERINRLSNYFILKKRTWR
jgi:hypothetical protein